jgi:hypothetical protein
MTNYRVSHRDIAREARTHHNQWILVRFYDSPSGATYTAHAIREGQYTAYQPAGHYQAQCRNEPGGFPVYVRHHTPQEP